MARLASAATADFKRAFKPSYEGTRLEVKFGCDGLDSKIKRITMEGGSGHGGGLELYRIERRAPDAAVYEVLGIRLRGYFDTHGGPYQIARSEIPAAVIEAHLPVMRTALVASLREVEPPPPPGGVAMGGSWGSSADFHTLVAIEDAGGRALERHFTGYDGSSSQVEYLPIQRAAAELAPFIAALQWQDEARPDDAVAFFEERFRAAEPRFGDQFAWWVRERHVQLASSLGTRALIPSLLRLLTPRADKDASEERTRQAALEALATITGWNPLVSPEGKPVAAEDAARAFLEECAKAGKASASE